MTYNDDIQQCIKTLSEGGIILYPTDTVWGIGCDATNDDAVEKIIQLKQRPDYKSFVTLVADIKTLSSNYTSPLPEAIEYLNTSIKPTTIIYENVSSISSKVKGADNSAAIRIPKDDFCNSLLKTYNKPIVSTSANMSGQPTPTIFSEIADVIKNGMDYIVRYRQDDNSPTQASSIVRWVDGRLIVIRE